MSTRRVNGTNGAVVISAILLAVISVGLVQAGALRSLPQYLAVQAAIEGVLTAAGGFTDCNENGVDDAQDIANLTSPDCDSNGVPDECQILVSSGASGGPFFCITDCDADCNDTGIPDACELSANDCNGDGRPDECGVPIECNNPITSFEDQRFAASGVAEGDLFGTSISVDCDLAVIGVHLDDLVACTDCGSAYVYRFDGGFWLQEAQLVASDATPDAQFGWSVSISGNKIVVGASKDDCAAGSNCGAVYVFGLDGNQWIEEAKLVAGDAASLDRFGYSVSIHADGILVGARLANCSAGVHCGAAYVFRYDDMNADWVEEAKLVASDAAANDHFGTSTAMNGDTAVVGAPSADCLAGDDCGAAYVYRWDAAIPEWVEEAKIDASDAADGDSFGEAISIHSNKIVVGAPNVNCALGPHCGAAYVNRYDDTIPGWVEEAKLTVANSSFDEFGSSVSIDGDTIAAGKPLEFQLSRGAAHVFRYNNGSQVWNLYHNLSASGGTQADGFGRSIAVRGNTVIVGAPFVACPAGGACGAAYTFDLTGPDCNCNGTADFCDITDCSGDPACDDCNNNGLPDECELSNDDCNGNQIPDACDIDSGTSNDCNGNGIPDGCEPLGDDCNGNLIIDECDTDCNLNGMPDDCEIAGGTAQDCNGNGMPDECEVEGDFLDVSPELSPFTFENPQSHTIPSPPFAFSDVTMSFAVRAHLNDPSEAITVHVNGTLVGTVFNVESTSCQSPAGTDQLVLPAATFNAARNGADALIGMIITDEVGGQCAPTSVSVTTSYDGGQDCNTNGVPDACDIADGTSQDCNGNGVPDECGPDCNGNGVSDECDIFGGTSNDCDGNSIPDDCDLQAGSTILHVDFEAGLPPGWTANFDVSVTDSCDVRPICDGAMWAYAGDPTACTYDTDGFSSQSHYLESPPILLPLTHSELHFCSMLDTEFDRDFAQVYVNGFSYKVFSESGRIGIWEDRAIDLSEFAGQTVTLTFNLRSNGDGNGAIGWQFDDIRIVSTGPDCNGNLIPDVCDIEFNDCNNNLIPDDCDLADCSGDPDCADCNGNAIPDVCDRLNNDCNENLIPDDCDLDACTGDPACADCNGDGRPDECGVVVNCGQTEVQKVTAMNAEEGDLFGIAVAISEDLMIVGNFPQGDHEPCEDVPSCGAAYIYRKNTLAQSWELEQELGPGDSRMGRFGVAVGIDGDIAAVGSPNHRRGPGAQQDFGSVDVFQFSSEEESWSGELHLDPSVGNGPESEHGTSVAVTNNTVVFGSPGSCDAFVTRRLFKRWTDVQALAPSLECGEYGQSIAIGGDVVMVGAARLDLGVNDAGAVYVYRYRLGDWNETQVLVASDRDVDDRFGHAVSIDRDFAVVGALRDNDDGNQSGSAYVFRYNQVTQTWDETQKLTASDAAVGNRFGTSVSISGHTLVVGAPQNAHNGLINAGAAYLFVYDANTQVWNEVRKFTASDAAEHDFFGGAVSISEETVVVGASFDSHAGGLLAGSAYIFTLTSGDCTCDGIANVCEPDYDGDGVPAGCDVCFGFDDADDADADGVPDGCDPCPLPDMDDTDGDGVCDLADICLGDDTVDLDGNGVPDECELEPPLAATAPHDRKKNRSLSFRPNNGGLIALRVTLMSSLNHPDAVGTSMWIGEPDTDGVAVLSPTPVARLWPETTVHATGCFVSPVAAYEIRATIDDGASFSDPLSIQTIDQPGVKFWGDVVGVFNGLEWTAPQRVTNIDDAVAVIHRWQQLDGSPHISVADVEPQVINKVVNFNDVLQVIFAFQGEPYPFGCPADPCQDNIVTPCL